MYRYSSARARKDVSIAKGILFVFFAVFCRRCWTRRSPPPTRHLQDLEVVALRTSAYARINSASHGQPFSRQHLEVAVLCRVRVGHPFSRAHFSNSSNSRLPRFAAYAHVSSSHGQPFARAHCRTRRWPPSAACQHVSSSHGQPFARAHFSTLRWPPSAAHVQTNTLSRSRCPAEGPRRLSLHPSPARAPARERRAFACACE